MPRRHPPTQNPIDPDAILPVNPTHAAQPENLEPVQEEQDPTEFLESTRYLFKEHSFDNLVHLAEQIRVFCTRRGEPVSYWHRKLTEYLEKHHKSVSLQGTLENLEIVVDRCHRGEFLLSFDRKIFDSFKIDKIVVLAKSDVRLEKSKRPEPRLTHLVVTTASTVSNAGLKSQDSISREEWETGIRAIARAYGRAWPTSTEVARDWELTILTGVGKNVGNFRWKVYGKGKYIRSNLIYAGEKVRCGEKLPDPEVMVKGDVGPPQNVAPSDPCFVHTSHSLARISIRQAQRIGYSGDLAHDGGLYFS